MKRLSCKGFVLKKSLFGESDVILKILTDTEGYITAKIRNGNNYKNRLHFLTHDFIFAEFELFYYKNFYTVDDGQLIYSFNNLTKDLNRLGYAARAADVFNDLLRFDGKNFRNYELWGYTINQLDKTSDPEFAYVVSAFKLLVFNGYEPYLQNCLVCGDELTDGGYFSFTKSGAVCQKASCLRDQALSEYVTSEEFRLLQVLILSPPEKIFRLKITTASKHKFCRILECYIAEKIERSFGAVKLGKQDFASEVAAIKASRSEHEASGTAGVKADPSEQEAAGTVAEASRNGQEASGTAGEASRNGQKF